MRQKSDMSCIGSITEIRYGVHLCVNFGRSRDQPRPVRIVDIELLDGFCDGRRFILSNDNG